MKKHKTSERLWVSNFLDKKLYFSDEEKQCAGSLSAALYILTYISYTAGVFFIFASLFKFDQHKKNPTQIPMSQPLTLFVIGAALCLLPTVINFATGGGSDKTISIKGSPT